MARASLGLKIIRRESVSVPCFKLPYNEIELVLLRHLLHPFVKDIVIMNSLQ